MSHRTNPLRTLTLTLWLSLFAVVTAQALPLSTFISNDTVGFTVDIPDGWTATTYEDENRIDVEDEAAIFIVDAIDLATVPDGDPEIILDFIFEGLFESFAITDVDLVDEQFLGDLEALRIDFEGMVEEVTVYGTLIYTFDDLYAYYVMFAVAADLYDAYEATLLAMVDSFTFTE